MEKPSKKSSHPYFAKLGIEIRKIRTNKGLSLEALGTEIGIDGPNMQKIEGGLNLTLSTLLKLCICLDITPSKLLERITWNLDEKDLEALTTPRNIKKKKSGGPRKKT